MRLPGLLLVLATVAALLGAPPAVYAAPNELSAPQVSPATGSTTTVFSFGVSYAGRFPATSVSVTVAGRTMAMHRVSGSAAQGAWSVSTTLPAGTWPATFSGIADQGNVASLAGPTVVVLSPAPVTPTPVVTARPGPDGDSPTGPVTDEPILVEPIPASTAPGSAPAAAPDPAPAATPASPGPAEGTSGDPTPVQAPSGSGPGSFGPGSFGPGSSGANGAPAAGAAAEPEPSEADALAAGAPDDTHGEEATPPPGGDDLVTMVLLVGMSGVAAIGLIGSAILVAGRRRTDDDEAPGEVSTAEAEAGAVLDRRMLRRARMRVSEDPIIASLGIDEPRPTRVRRRAGQVGRGPGEREVGGRD